VADHPELGRDDPDPISASDLATLDATLRGGAITRIPFTIQSSRSVRVSRCGWIRSASAGGKSHGVEPS